MPAQHHLASAPFTCPAPTRSAATPPATDESGIYKPVSRQVAGGHLVALVGECRAAQSVRWHALNVGWQHPSPASWLHHATCPCYPSRLQHERHRHGRLALDRQEQLGHRLGRERLLPDRSHRAGLLRHVSIPPGRWGSLIPAYYYARSTAEAHTNLLPPFVPGAAGTATCRAPATLWMSHQHRRSQHGATQDGAPHAPQMAARTCCLVHAQCHAITQHMRRPCRCQPSWTSFGTA